MSTTSQFLITGGQYAGNTYVTDDVDSDVVVYRMYDGASPLSTGFNISYTQSTGIWSEGPGSANPFYLNSEDSGITATDIIGDAETIWGYNQYGALRMSFPSPWYQAPTYSIQTHGFDLTSAVLTYDVTTNRLSWIIPASFSSTSDPLIQAHRTDYVLQLNSVEQAYLIHTNGIATIANSTNDIVPGIWRIRRIISMPVQSKLTLVQIEVTQAQVDSYYSTWSQAALDAAAAAQAALDAAAAAQAAADAAASGSNAPPNTPRGRRGNHNFW